MLCQRCGKNTATTHIKTIINGKVTEQSLCGYCAAKDGFSSNSFSNILASMLGSTLASSSIMAENRCECCNSTFARIAETGKVGCANCYKQFGEELLPYLKRIHGSVIHTGKTPGSKQLVVAKNENSISELKTKLASLVAAEKYEDAAIVRDEIKRLEGTE